MKTYLLGWNPDEWQWKNYDIVCRDCSQTTPSPEKWRCSSTLPKLDDAVYVIRYGDVEPKGILAKGKVTSVSEKGEDGNNYIGINLEKVFNYKINDILLQSDLEKKYSDQYWSPQGSGIEIKDDIAEKLNEDWNNLVTKNKTLKEQLENSTELDCDAHDGSYELIREIINSYSRLNDTEKNNIGIDDLNAVYLMCIGTWKHSISKKKDAIDKTHLPVAEKTKLKNLLDTVWTNAQANRYSNRETDKVSVGMFGTGFMSFKNKSTDEIAKKFIKCCIEIKDLTNDDEVFNKLDTLFDTNFKGMKCAAASQILHCLKPTLVPVLNSRSVIVYDYLNIDIEKSLNIDTFVANCRKVRDYRNDNFKFRNYRIMDLLGEKLTPQDEIVDFDAIDELLINNKGKHYSQKKATADDEALKAVGEAARNEFIKLCKLVKKQINLKMESVSSWINQGQNVPEYLWVEFKDKDKILYADRFITKKDKNGNEKKENKVIPYSVALSVNIDSSNQPYYSLRVETRDGSTETNEYPVFNNNIQGDINHSQIYYESYGNDDSYQKIDTKEDAITALNTGNVRKIRSVYKINGPYIATRTAEIVNDAANGIEQLKPAYEKIFELTPINCAKSTKSEDKTMKTENIKDTIKKYIDNDYKQIILTGAPGTGKTYSVKEFTGMDDKTKFVQFHPSYDYSDFVEGLRPVQLTPGGEPTFVRIDGTFKKFCRYVVEQNYKKFTKGNELKDITGPDDNTKYNNFIEKYSALETDNGFVADKYFFIIDEINRADLAKVFGELMYCLEGSYRGLKDKTGKLNTIETQYSNLETRYVENGIANKIPFDCFLKGFFIPKNIYIIGTMNDIDRSVESFDFALRRRFEWVDIKANDVFYEGIKGTLSEKITDGTITDDQIKDLTEKVIKMNEVISKDDNQFMLTEAYHIGHAYFKNYDGTEDSLKTIFETNVTSILKEYTRGRKAKDVEDNLLSECRKALGIK